VRKARHNAVVYDFTLGMRAVMFTMAAALLLAFVVTLRHPGDRPAATVTHPADAPIEEEPAANVAAAR
jgi:hypothetical protein